ncbi:hypothetical protein DGG96_18380 [Legionella qingyii]|uniref:Uncharacterized protein n=1 Tax=Legionella qingyii TaxID=2184757 RepID=A0A317TYP4_9GAMM|nr:hypothetical protein [Legionella qingyii]PWY54178.1 hypothetical protein DGG96_18380 [Legionella qingyii]RUR23599.1 hypothetical protein ELY16_13130 [Legionella qingyii]RUR24077.1 hypothetical protein ELY20_05810 [Legionella qingyii]
MQGKQELNFGQYVEIGGNLFSEDQKESEIARGQAKEILVKAGKNAFGFFTPYKSIGDFGTALASPIATPLAFSLVAGLSTIAAALATITAAGSLLVASGAGTIGLFNKNAKETALTALAVAGTAAIVAVACAAITVALALITAVVTPLLVAQIFTRAGASVISAFSSCCSKPEKKDESIEHASLLVL